MHLEVHGVVVEPAEHLRCAGALILATNNGMAETEITESSIPTASAGPECETRNAPVIFGAGPRSIDALQHHLRPAVHFSPHRYAFEISD